MTITEYWVEAFLVALDDAEVVHDITDPSSLLKIGNSLRISHENIGMAFGHDDTPNPLKREIESLKVELRNEQDKRVCTYCNGTGRLIDYALGCGRSTSMECHKCKGKGKL